MNGQASEWPGLLIASVLWLLPFTLLPLLTQYFQQDSYEDRELKPTSISSVGHTPQLGLHNAVRDSPVPDFRKDYPSPRWRKEAFFSWLWPSLLAENTAIMAERTELQALRATHQQRRLSDTEQAWLMRLVKRYHIAWDGYLNTRFWDTAEEHVDAIPASIVLAQAAYASSWGQAARLRKANNLFGHACFTQGCGVALSKGQREWRRFASVKDSLRFYMIQLNANKNNALFRTLRAVRRSIALSLPEGRSVVQGLEQYSQDGQKYVDDIRRIIRINKLQRYDHALAAILSSQEKPPAASPES